MIADRYQRSLLRLLKAFRDMRRLVGTDVLNGEQLNVPDQQIVTRDNRTDGSAPRRIATRTRRKARPATIVRVSQDDEHDSGCSRRVALIHERLRLSTHLG